MSFHLLRPEWLWALLPAALLAVMLWRGARGSGQWHSVIDPALLPHLLADEPGGRRRNLVPALLLTWALACLAAAGPSLHKIPQPLETRQDALVLVLDLSYSMTAGDLAPSRIDRARQKLRDLLDHRREGQTGLIAYAGDAHVVTPLTDDTPTIANLLPSLDPAMMPIPGSAPGSAIRLALELLHSAGVPRGRILLLSDGIDATDRNAVVEALEGSGVELSILGVGTATGAPLPLPGGGFVKDDKGTIVMPGLTEEELRRTAAQAGGRYRQMQVDDSDLDYLLAPSALPGVEDTRELSRRADTWEDQGYLLVLALLPVILLLFRRGWIACLVPLLFLPLPQSARASGWDDLWLTRDQQGQQALQAEDYERAAQLFENRGWAGTAAYKGGDYATAEQQFASGDSADAWYNRGNALARQGRLQEAADAYRESLDRAPEQADAMDNLALVEELLKQQEQQNQDQQDQDQQNQDQQNQDQQDQDQDQRDQGQQGQDQQDQEQQGQDQQGQDQQDREQQDREQQDQEQQDQEQNQQGQAAADDKTGEETAQADGQAQDAENRERDQALEQWLRRVPDDPAGLLREKFRYESRERLKRGETEKDDAYW